MVNDGSPGQDGRLCKVLTKCGVLATVMAGRSAEQFVQRLSNLDARSVEDGSLLWSTPIGECRVQAFAGNGQTFLFICGWIATIGPNGGPPQQWLVPQGEFQWVEPFGDGNIASSYTGEGPVSVVALGAG